MKAYQGLWIENIREEKEKKKATLIDDKYIQI